MVATQKHTFNNYIYEKWYFEIPAKANTVNLQRHSSELNNHSAKILWKETADLQVKTNQLKEN